MKIYSIDNSVLLDVKVTSSAVHEEEMMKSNDVQLSWKSNVKINLGVGTYIIPFADGLRYRLIEPYEPTQESEDTFNYQPEFQHPIMWLGKVPFTYATKNTLGEDVVQQEWEYTGLTLNILKYAVDFINTTFGFSDKEKFVLTPIGSIDTNVSLSFSSTDVLSALSAIANGCKENKCEWHLSWEYKALYFGQVSVNLEETIPTLKVGENVGKASVSQTKDGYYNVFYPQGSTRNMSVKAASGENVSTGIRLGLDKKKYPTGEIDTRENANEPKQTLAMTFDEVYPHVDCYVYNVRKRTRYLLDDENKKVVSEYNSDGSVKSYKTYTVWYMRLAYPLTKQISGKAPIATTREKFNGSLQTLYWYDYEVDDKQIIDGYTLCGSFSVNTNEGALGSTLVAQPSNGDGFELKYHKVAETIPSNSTSGDSGVTILKGDYEIIFVNQNDIIIPTNESEGLIPRGEKTPSIKGNIVILYNIAMGDDEVTAAQDELERKTLAEIAYRHSDLNNYAFTAYPNVFAKNNPHLYVGQRVKYDDGNGYSYTTRVLKLTTNLDYDICQEITVGNSTIKGTQTQLKEDVQGLISGTISVGSGLSYEQVVDICKNYVSNRYLSKTHDDTAEGVITFSQGFISKEWGIFNKGWKTGSYDGNTIYDHGAMVDKDGHGVFQSLFARGFISAPKFVFNEINVTKAEQWNTNAFGTIESVDTKTRQITLHLEENDYGSVEVGDICRGIFADLGDTYKSDNNVDGALDDCNFVIHKGFFTTYFAVEKIITNEKGRCVFQYRKRTKDTPDPCPYMDFAQYGSFVDKARQSSMYMSSRGHSFIELLDGVDNWEIQPQNRGCRYGWLGDLVIQHDDGTKETLEGNGLFAQNHVYFGGDIIKLSNISDLDDLQKMAGAYDVSLSRYQGVITVDDMGNVIGGLYTLSDMPQDDGSTKQVKQWRLSTAVFVRKGQDILLEEDESNEQVTEGHYRVTAFGDGCECEIANSTVYITSIKNLHDGEADTEEEIDYDEMRKMERCRVSIVVELEGKTSKTIEFPVRIAHDSLPFLDCDLDNEHASVSWNTKAKKYTGFPIKSEATLLYHNEPWQIDKDSHVDGLPDGLKADVSFENKKMQISITTNGKKSGDFLAKKEGETTVTTHNLSIHIIGTYAGARYEYSKLLTIDRRADTTVYEIIPSSDSIIMDKDKTLSVNSLSCEVWATSSDDKRYKVEDLAAAGLEIKYCKGEGTPNIAFGTSVSVNKNDKKVTLGLFNKTTGEILDKESVPIIAWGEDGKGVEFIYFRSQDAQTVFDNFKPEEWFADAKYQGGSEAEYIGEIQKKYPNWTDDPQGVSPTYPFEYVSVRKSVNGVWGKFSQPAIYATMARNIKSVNTFYAIVAQDKAGTKPSDSEFTHDDLTDVVIKDNKGKWLWSADKVEYYDTSASVLLNKTCLGTCEELANVTEQYGVSTDPSVSPTTPYDASGAYPTNLKEGDCVWSRDHIVWLKGSDTYTNWQFIGMIGVSGDGVTSTEIAYGSSTSDKTIPTSWYNNQTQVTINDTYCWFWTRTIWHYKKSAYKTAYTKSYKGKNGDPATYYEARFSEQRAAVYVEKGYETGYVGVKFVGSFYLVKGDTATKASGSGLGLKLEFLNEAGTVIGTTKTASVNGSTFSYANSSKTDIQYNYRNQGENKITSCRYTVTCNDGRDTKSGVIPIGFNAGSVFYHTDTEFESLLQNPNGSFSELTQTVNGIYTHVQRLETNMFMGTTTALGWTLEKTIEKNTFDFSDVSRQFTMHNFFPAYDAGYTEDDAYCTLKSPIIRVVPDKRYIISFQASVDDNVRFNVGIRYGTASLCNQNAKYFDWNSKVENANKAENVIVRSKANSNRYFVIFTAASGYDYLQILFINAVNKTKYKTTEETSQTPQTNVYAKWPYSTRGTVQIGSDRVSYSENYTVKTTEQDFASYHGQDSGPYGKYTVTSIVRVSVANLYITKPQLELAFNDDIADIEPSEYKETQNAIESYIKQTADSIELRASKIIFKGETIINDKFWVDTDGNVHMANAEVSGTLTALSGRIGGSYDYNPSTGKQELSGGFKISGTGLTYIVDGEMDKEDMAYIICRNDYYGRFAGIGANVLPPSSGSAAVARFENNDTKSWYTENIAMILEAKGQSAWNYGIPTKNIACATYGGCFTGFALGVRVIDTSTGDKDITLTESDNVVTIIGNGTCNLHFPVMNTYDDGHILIIKKDGNCNVNLYPNSYIDSSGVYRSSYIRYDTGATINGSGATPLSIGSWMDSMMFIFHATLSITPDKSNTTYYGSWIEYKLPRAW